MSGDLPELEDLDALLARTARMDFAFARHVQEKALASDDAQELADLARAYARLTRSLRQNVALLAKQKADRARAEREAARDARPTVHDLQERAVEDRTDELQAAVERVISAAADGDEARHTEWCHRFDRELEDWIETPDWLDDDIDAVVRRVCATLDLPDDLAARWRRLPDPTFFPDPEPATPEAVAAANAVARALADRLRAPDPRPSGRPSGAAPPRPPWRNSG